MNVMKFAFPKFFIVGLYHIIIMSWYQYIVIILLLSTHIIREFTLSLIGDVTSNNPLVVRYGCVMGHIILSSVRSWPPYSKLVDSILNGSFKILLLKNLNGQKNIGSPEHNRWIYKFKIKLLYVFSFWNTVGSSESLSKSQCMKCYCFSQNNFVLIRLF